MCKKKYPIISDVDDEKLDACCLTEYHPLPGIPQGQIIKITEINTYLTLGTDSPSKNKAIVLLTDVFDLFSGDPIASSVLENVPQNPGEKMCISTKIRLAGKFLKSFAPWLFRHRQAVTLPIVEKFFKALRSEKGVTRIQAVGYCFGGLYALLVGNGELHLADVIVGCHVSLVNKTHFEQLQVPAAFVCAQEDNQFTDALRSEAEKILARKLDISSKFLLTEGTVHGFAARPDPNNPVIMKAFTQANNFIVEWAKAYL
ncbi:unnamed protein product [Rotaria magnacalcarata]|uniref:Dienelactone hydrolase domain-containing protein n=2 Tax=Rotaria magnacalcarata TaxID=392030 RepID=A0A816XJM9_9BILA|nr:unnamed protein product [Rotaria magnacalcarata]CAF4221929.1 unnamed protein product [Rotaria magnacalcarata]